MILVGDIGGTKTILALYEELNGVLECRGEHQFASQEYREFEKLVEKFLELYSYPKIEAVSLGIAGPIIEGVCKTTNLPWVIESRELRERFGTPYIYLLNDLEATAYGMLHLPKEEFVTLNAREEIAANRAVIAAGTGLGEAMLFYDGATYHPVGTEGGHCDFAPTTTLQDELLLWMRKEYPHVSVERFVSGMGLGNIYDFLKERASAKEPKSIQERREDEDRNILITEAALKGDALCVATLKLFVEIYGAEAGNLALKSLSLGGVYIGGGIAPKILPFLQDGTFLEAFVAKGRFSDMLKEMPIKISLNEKAPLIGAAYFAKERFYKLQ